MGGRTVGGPQVQAANAHLGSHMMAALRNVSQTEAQTEWERMTGRLEETQTKTIALLRNPGTKGAEAGRDYVKSARVFRYLLRRHALTPSMMTFQYLNIYKSGHECRKLLFFFSKLKLQFLRGNWLLPCGDGGDPQWETDSRLHAL